MNNRPHGGSRSRIDFSVNLNPSIKTRDVKQMLSSLQNAAMMYPEQRGDGFVSDISSKYGIAPQNIVLGNGSIELFYMLPAVLKPARALTLEPTFCEYGYICEINGIPVTRVLPATEFTWDFNVLKNQAKEGDIIFICNPNNPTGGLFSKKDILPLLDTGAFVAIDEAFMDFSGDDQSLIKDAVMHENLIVVKSLTKIYSIAGLRVGFCAAGKAVIKRFRDLLPLWNVNGIALEVAREFIKTPEILSRTTEFIEKEKGYIKNRMTRIKQVTLFDSYANFFLAKSDGTTRLKQFAAAKGVALRDNGGFHGLDWRYFRFAVKKREENKLLMDVFDEFFNGAGRNE